MNFAAEQIRRKRADKKDIKIANRPQQGTLMPNTMGQPPPKEPLTGDVQIPPASMPLLGSSAYAMLHRGLCPGALTDFSGIFPSSIWRNGLACQS